MENIKSFEQFNESIVDRLKGKFNPSDSDKAIKIIYGEIKNNFNRYRLTSSLPNTYTYRTLNGDEVEITKSGKNYMISINDDSFGSINQTILSDIYDYLEDNYKQEPTNRDAQYVNEPRNGKNKVDWNLYSAGDDFARDRAYSYEKKNNRF